MPYAPGSITSHEHQKQTKSITKLGRKKIGTNLLPLALDPVKDGLEGALREAALLPRLHVLLISLAQPLGAKVEGVAEGLVDALENVIACHEDLGAQVSAFPRAQPEKNE